MKIEQFLIRSEGTWLSMRSSHSLAFQKFEEVISEINIKLLSKDDEELKELLRQSSYSDSEIQIPFKVEWESKSNWRSDNESDTTSGSSILVPISLSDKSGLLLRSAGYTEKERGVSNFEFLSDNTFIIKTEYEFSNAEERIWFLTDNVRCRSSVIKSFEGKGIIQTSFASEIKKIK